MIEHGYGFLKNRVPCIVPMVKTVYRVSNRVSKSALQNVDTSLVNLYFFMLSKSKSIVELKID